MRPVNQMKPEQKRNLSEIRRAQIALDNEIQNPYPCGVCGKGFRSRYELATHPHGGAR